MTALKPLAIPSLYRTISSLSVDLEEMAEESIPSPVTSCESFEAISLKEMSTVPTLKSYELFSDEEKSELGLVLGLVEGAYARVMDIELSPLEHAPFLYGYWSCVYMEDTKLSFDSWLVSKSRPQTSSAVDARLTVFQSIISRSLPLKSTPYKGDYFRWANNSIRKLKNGQEIWLRLTSRCGDLPGNHLLILKVRRVERFFFNISLVNVGYKAIRDRFQKGMCRDLVVKRAKDNRRFYGFLKKVVTSQADVPAYYHLLRQLRPGHVSLGSSRPYMNKPLCATETLRRCYKDFLGVHLYSQWMAFWSGKELHQIETKLLAGSLEMILSLEPTAPAHVFTVPTRSGNVSDTLTAAAHPVPTVDADKLSEFLRALALTHLKFLSASQKSIKIDEVPLTLQKLLGHTSEEQGAGWTYVARHRRLSS